MKEIKLKTSELTPYEIEHQDFTPSITTPEEVLQRFFNFLDVSPKTSETYRKALKQFFAFLSEQGIKTPQREDIITFKKSLTDKGRKSATISLYLSATRRFFTWCEAEGIYSDITRGIKSPRIDKGHKKDCFSGTQIKDIMNSMDRSNLEGLRNFAIFGLITACGLRTIEIQRADVEDLRNVGGVTCLFVLGKGRTTKSDFVKVPPQVEKAIRAYLNARGKTTDTEPLFASCSRRNKGGRLTTRSISGIAKSAMTHAGYISARWTAHSLRHTAVTLALMAGNTLEDVKEFARHSSVNTTLVYSHAVNRMKSACETSIAQAIF